jgi:hypothetical protein
MAPKTSAFIFLIVLIASPIAGIMVSFSQPKMGVLFLVIFSLCIRGAYGIIKALL